MCGCQLVNVFGVLSREYPRDYVFIAVRSALRYFCRSYCVLCHHLNCSFRFLGIHAFKLVFCIHYKYHTA